MARLDHVDQVRHIQVSLLLGLSAVTRFGESARAGAAMDFDLSSGRLWPTLTVTGRPRTLRCFVRFCRASVAPGSSVLHPAVWEAASIITFCIALDKMYQAVSFDAV